MALKTEENNIKSNAKHQSKIQNKRAHRRGQAKPELKISRRREHNSNYTYHSLSVIPMATFYPTIYPLINEWSPIFPIQCPVYTAPVPVIVNPIPAIQAPIFQYITPAISPQLTDKPIATHSVSTYSDLNLEPSDAQLCLEDPLKLPRDMFPSARMLAIDPNSIINEFCKLTDIESNVPWLLDLELGIPKSPITRPIPIYNVKLNSINCKNTPDAIHPGFESCCESFKKVLLFYYDCVISSWYRGYVLMNSDKSVDNFQSWLLHPMQELGMCWP